MTASRTQFLGLASDVKPLNVAAYLLSSFFSVASLVFLSASTSFVLTAVVRLPLEHLGRTSGSLVLLDELVALPAVLVWGRLADVYGFRLVSVVGHILVAIALSIFVQARTSLQLYLARVLVSVSFGTLIFLVAISLEEALGLIQEFCLLAHQIGFSALTTMLSAILASMTVAQSTCDSSEDTTQSSEVDQTENTPLMPSTGNLKETDVQRSAKLSGIIGFCSGLGALFAVFFLLRLPPFLTNSFPDLSPRDALQESVKISFYITSTLTLIVGLFLIVGLRRRGEKLGLVSKAPQRNNLQSSGWWNSLRPLALGFDLCWLDWHLIIAYAAGFSARATSIAVSSFIPVLVNQYYIASGQCQLDRPDAPPDEVKKGCHAAFALASALTGTVQLSALLLAPVAGWLASHYSQPVLLASSNAIGAVAFLTMALLPSPHHFLMWPICIALGVAQISGVVISLSLCASGRCRIQHSLSLQKTTAASPSNAASATHHIQNEVVQTDVSGAIAGVYSLCGGLGILIASVGGSLADWQPQAPFFITGFLAAVVSFLCFGFVYYRT